MNNRTWRVISVVYTVPDFITRDQRQYSLPKLTLAGKKNI